MEGSFSSSAGSLSFQSACRLDDDDGDPSFSSPGHAFLTSTPSKARRPQSSLRESDTESLSPPRARPVRERLVRRPLSLPAPAASRDQDLLAGSTGSSTLVEPHSDSPSNRATKRKGKERERDELALRAATLSMHEPSAPGLDEDKEAEETASTRVQQRHSTRDLGAYLDAKVLIATPKAPGALAATRPHETPLRRSPGTPTGAEQVKEAFEKYITGPGGALGGRLGRSRSERETSFASAPARRAPATPAEPQTPHPTGFYNFSSFSPAAAHSPGSSTSTPARHRDTTTRSPLPSSNSSRRHLQLPLSSRLSSPSGSELGPPNSSSDEALYPRTQNSRVRWAMASSDDDDEQVEEARAHDHAPPYYQEEKVETPALPLPSIPTLSPRKPLRGRVVRRGSSIRQPADQQEEPLPLTRSSKKPQISDRRSASPPLAGPSPAHLSHGVSSPVLSNSLSPNVSSSRPRSETNVDPSLTCAEDDGETDEGGKAIASLAHSLLVAVRSLSASSPLPSRRATTVSRSSAVPALPSRTRDTERESERDRRRAALAEKMDALKTEDDRELEKRKAIMDQLGLAQREEVGLVERLDELRRSVDRIAPRVSQDMEAAIAKTGSWIVVYIVVAQILLMALLLGVTASPANKGSFHPALFIPLHSSPHPHLRLSPETLALFTPPGVSAGGSWIGSVTSVVGRLGTRGADGLEPS